MLSPESAEEKEGDWCLRAVREMLTLSDAEIDHDLGAIGGTESVEGGVFPDPKRRRLVEDDEVMEEEEKQKMEEIRKEKFKVMPPLDMDELLRIAHSGEPVPFGLCSRDIDAIMDIRDKDEDVVEEEEVVDEKVKEILDNVEKASVLPTADVFVERDTIDKYKLKTEYDLFLLECRYNQNLHPKNFAPKDRPPIMDSPYFDPSARQHMFNRWMKKRCSGLQKEECEFAIRARYEKEQKKDFSTRIRYIRYKRGLAEELGLIPESDI